MGSGSFHSLKISPFGLGIIFHRRTLARFPNQEAERSIKALTLPAKKGVSDNFIDAGFALSHSTGTEEEEEAS